MSKYTRYAGEFELVSGRIYRVVKPITWRIGAEFGPKLTVPEGFLFDVTIPAFARFIFNPHDMQYFKAAALHDYMLINDWDRLTAGAEFNSALRADGVAGWRRFLMWLSVSLWKWK